MKKIDLYHGSLSIIKKPKFCYGVNYKDYGQGFYCTQSKELSKEWASSIKFNGYSNHYKIDIEGLNILNLFEEKYSILNYLSLICENRSFSKNTPIMKLSSEWLIENYSLNTKDIDIIIGYRGDDSYFSFVLSFLKNEISYEQLRKVIQRGEEEKEIVIKSKKTFERIEFIDSEVVEKNEYYKKRIKRDETLRKLFLDELEKDTLTGRYIKDLMKGEVNDT